MSQLNQRKFLLCTAISALRQKKNIVFRSDLAPHRVSPYSFTKAQTKLTNGVITIENSDVMLYLPKDEVIACEINE